MENTSVVSGLRILEFGINFKSGWQFISTDDDNVKRVFTMINEDVCLRRCFTTVNKYDAPSLIDVSNRFIILIAKDFTPFFEFALLLIKPSFKQI